MQPINAEETHLTPAELTARWKHVIKVGTLSNWRVKGEGPKFVKFGKAVLYPMSAVVEWENAQRGN